MNLYNNILTGPDTELAELLTYRIVNHKVLDVLDNAEKQYVRVLHHN